MDKYTIITEAGVLIEHIEAETWVQANNFHLFYKGEKCIFMTPYSSTILNETLIGKTEFKQGSNGR